MKKNYTYYALALLKGSMDSSPLLQGSHKIGSHTLSKEPREGQIWTEMESDITYE